MKKYIRFLVVLTAACQADNRASRAPVPTWIPGLVFAGGLDGYARAYKAATGKALWEFDTNKSFETVNGIEGHGGAIDGPGPVVANGMVFLTAGMGFLARCPGM